MLTAIKEGPDHSSIVKFSEIQKLQKLPFFRGTTFSQIVLRPAAVNI
jgi:hypothetical protein